MTARPGPPRTTLVDGRDGALEVLSTGRGSPRTVLAHGAGGSIATTRPYAGRVAGTRTFVHQRGHGRSHRPTGTGWGYAELAADLWAVAAHLLADQPGPVRTDPAVVRWSRDRAEELVGSGVPAVLRVLVGRVPTPDPALLGRVACPVLVLGQEDDPLHPASVARDVAALLPRSVLHVSGPGGIMWEHRGRTRDLVGEFLSAT